MPVMESAGRQVRFSTSSVSLPSTGPIPSTNGYFVWTSAPRTWAMRAD